jgi:aminopeptidase N
VEPSWKILEQFVIYDLQNVFALDALESSHQISIEVGHPDEINEIFDRISYGKGNISYIHVRDEGKYCTAFFKIFSSLQRWRFFWL